MLADIGLTRADLRDAFSEPFWEDPTALLRERALERRVSRAVLRTQRTRASRTAPTVRHQPAGAPGDLNSQTAEPSHRPLDPSSANIPSRGRIKRPPAPPAGAFFFRKNLSIITLTKQGLTNSQAQTGQQIVTPAMLAAGVHVIAEEYGVCGADIAPDLARDVFKAMWEQKDPEPSLSIS